MEPVVTYLIPAVVAAGVAIAGYFLSLAVARWLSRRGAPAAGVRTVRIAISLLSLLAAGAVLFVAFGPITAVSGLTFSAIVGLGITLALQTTIANVIAGFILLQDRLLRLNDSVQIGGVRGQVVQLGLVTALLRLEDGSIASVSNSSLLSGPLINRTAGERLKGEY
jgi:potassium-dependent mechanosensitive channel